MLFFRNTVLSIATLLVTAPCFADERRQPLVDSIIVGALDHNIQSDDADGVDANVELRFNLPIGLPEGLEVLPTIGGTVSFDDDGASFGYAGATLHYQHSSGFFAEGFLGFAGHTADTPVDANEVDLGCDVLFREAGEIGYAWQQHRIGAVIAHYSHGGILCNEDENDGLTQVGVRYGYRF